MSSQSTSPDLFATRPEPSTWPPSGGSGAGNMELRLSTPSNPMGPDAVLPEVSLPHIRREPAQSRLWLTDEHVKQLRHLAELSYPFEACGLLIGSIDAEDRRTFSLVQASNLSPTLNRDRFVLDPQDYLDTEHSARRSQLEIIGIWHSHPDHPAVPSPLDLESAWTEHSQVIVSVDAMGDTVLSSWRLEDRRFTPEEIRVVPRHPIMG